MPDPSPDPSEATPVSPTPPEGSLEGPPVGEHSNVLTHPVTEAELLLLTDDIAVDDDDDRIKKKLGILFWICAGWFGVVVLLAVFAKFLPMPDPAKPIQCGLRTCSRLPPGPGHIFGTDGLGRDMFSRVVWGAQVSLMVGFASIFISLLVGGGVGIVAGYFRGPVESSLMAITDIFLAFPPLLLALALVTFTDNRSVRTVILAISIVAIPPVARLVRANTLVFAQREFVLASRTLGASHFRIIIKEVLPNVILPILSFAIIGVAVAIVAEGALAFLGLSVQPPTPTWGGMINEGRNTLDTYPHITLIPCAIMFLTILSLNLAGDRVREYFDIKESVL